MVGFEELLARARMRVQEKIRNGEITERGLARLAGISQSHVHNALKGARDMRPKTVDRVLRAMRINICDLIVREDWDSGTPSPHPRSGLQRPPASR